MEARTYACSGGCSGFSPSSPSAGGPEQVRAYTGKYGWPSGANRTLCARSRLLAASNRSTTVVRATSSR